MIRNFFITAWRNLLKNKTFSAINMAGLAIGMAIAMLIGLWVWDELSFNDYHKDHNRIAQLMEQQTVNGIVSTFHDMPFPIGRELQKSYAGDFKYVVMASVRAEHFLTRGEEKFTTDGIYMDVDGPKMLTLKMLDGNSAGLKDPHSILLSASTAKAIFGNKPAINNTITIDNRLTTTVTGVYEDLPRNTTFSGVAFIAPWELYRTSEQWIINSDKENKWDNNSFQLFAEVTDNTSFAAVDKKIVGFKQAHVAPEDKKYHTKLFLHPMDEWHLRSHWDDNGIKEGGLITYVWLFSIIGIFVVILACINFMNLSTARSEKRAREVGIRKTIGSLRGQIIGQFYSESLLMVAFSFLLSLLIVYLSLPFFNDISAKAMTIPYTRPAFWLIGLAFTLLTGVIAGSYPALYLSSFKPIAVLKGTARFRTSPGQGTTPWAKFFKTGRMGSMPRKVLVVLQFTISIALAIGTLVVYQQVNYSRNRPIGYDRSGVMMIRMKSGDFYGKYDLLSTQLKSSGAVVQFAESSSPVTEVWASNDDFNWPGKDPELPVEFNTIWVTPDFGRTVGWQFTAGRDFSEAFKTDSSSVVINEAAVKFMGLKDPVGTNIKWGNPPDVKTYRIVGVIKDMVMESPFDPVKQALYFMDHNNVNWIVLKLNPQQSAGASLAKIEAVFKQLVPAAPFDYKFADTEFAQKFSAEERVGRLSSLFATLAIFISCLGLFGLASFVAEQRTREIGVRKVLGASLFSIWKLLSGDFIGLVGISVLIASPLAWLFMHNWLQKYSYRTELPWWIFTAVAAGALIITVLTISAQAIRTAWANPVKSLKES